MINIYVDGSYNEKTNQAGYAYIIIKNNKVINKFNGSIIDHYGSRNVTGEIYAVVYALNHLSMAFYQNKVLKIQKIIINYDYLGIEKWATGEWKTNKELTKKYVDYLKRINLPINFNKIKSHSGNKYNDMVDLLAKQACGIK